MIEKKKISTIISERKTLVSCCKQKESNVKLEAKKGFVLIKKDIWTAKKKFVQWILKNILENETLQGKARFIMDSLYKVEFLKGIIILVAGI